MTRRPRIYIASPYTIGDPAVNVRRQMDAFKALLNKGYSPFAPLLWHFQHIVYPETYGVWAKLGLEWVLACDLLVRLPGESKGADAEVQWAVKNGIYVYRGLDSVPTLT